MDAKCIRNFTIIAHIDHGKSTLADRLLEFTNTVEKRKMRDQVLDSMELERERGITIKMQPVRMMYDPKFINHESYILNLIDTPGHIDFSYEVSRALKAVEGAVLLVDATQGVQAQTLTTLALAQAEGLTILPVVSKIDAPLARVLETKEELSRLIGVSEEEVLLTSGKTGEGIEQLLEAIVERIPPPKDGSGNEKDFRALVFDFEYRNHQGVILYVRVFDGEVRNGMKLYLKAVGEEFVVPEIGIFSPEHKPVDSLGRGEIGYIVTGIKRPGLSSVGDTIVSSGSALAPLPGYATPKPVVWASLYPESQDDFDALRQALLRLKLSDASLSFEEEHAGALGRGYRCGFLGMLHIEIVTERLKREFNLSLVITTPSIRYEVTDKKGVTSTIVSPSLFPDDGTVESVREPWTILKIITSSQFLGAILQRAFSHEAQIGESETFGDNRTAVTLHMPLRQLMRNFFDEVKSVSSGFGSLSYELGDLKPAEVTRLDILVADEVVPAFSRVIGKLQVAEESERAVERLHAVLPRQLFETKIQAKALGRIIASRTLPALKKDVTGYLYGGDITRKMKLWEKQKKGKKRLKERGEVNIPHEVFLKMLRGEE